MAQLKEIQDLDSGFQVLEPKRSSGGGAWWIVLFLLAVLGGLGYLGWQERDRLNGQVAAARQGRDTAKQEATAAEAARVELAEQLKSKDAKIAELSATVEQKSSEGQTNDRLIAELKSKLDGKDGEVSADANRVAVNLVDQILFKSGEAELAPRGKEVLGKVGAVLKDLTDKQILIGGHTDDRPIHTDRFPSNWELSAVRAVNVVHYLTDTVGVDPHKIAAAAYSQFHPRAKGKAKNRRIEILLTPMVEVKKEPKAKIGKR